MQKSKLAKTIVAGLAACLVSASLLVGCGGNAMVKAAYSCGKPALGVGAGNVPAYMHKDCNTGQKMWDSLCVINAVYPQMFSYSGHGFVSLTEDDKIMFTEHPRGNFIYQLPGDKDWNAKQLALLKSYLKSSQEKR